MKIMEYPEADALAQRGRSLLENPLFLKDWLLKYGDDFTFVKSDPSKCPLALFVQEGLQYYDLHATRDTLLIFYDHPSAGNSLSAYVYLPRWAQLFVIIFDSKGWLVEKMTTSVVVDCLERSISSWREEVQEQEGRKIAWQKEKDSWIHLS